MVFQQKFIEILKQAAPESTSLANEMSDVLAISLDSSYRRMRCETVISIDEVVILCLHFQIPLESLNNEINQAVTFRYHPLLNSPEKFKNYLESINADLSKVSKTEDAQLQIAAEDIPVFHHFNSPILAKFKCFYWMKSILSLEDFAMQRFDSESIDSFYAEECRKIYSHYSKINGIEIWTEETISSTLKQLHYYWDAEYFANKSEAFALLDEVENQCKRIQKQAEYGKKMNADGNLSSVDFYLYISDILIGNNCLILKAKEHAVSYISYNSFNSMGTSNKPFNEQTNAWMKNLKSKSVLISAVAEKQRNQFFKSLYGQIAVLRKYFEENG